MREYWETDGQYGAPTNRPLFLDVQKERAEQILKAVVGMRICSALALLEQCKIALLQSTVDVD